MSAPVDVRGVLRREIDRAGGVYFEDGRDLIAVDSALTELIEAAAKRVRECQMCGGYGLIDTSSGQTPDTYQPDAMDCPECSELGHALARVQGGAK